jgi:hypothetical protein
MLFIAVALFGMLAYAFSQNSRTSMTWIETEKQNAAVIGGQDCANAMDMALKRLEARGCGNLVSYRLDGTNGNDGAPKDGSCSLYHPNGGGLKNCNNTATPTYTCLNGPVGTRCPDGSIYVGQGSGNVRVYMNSVDTTTSAPYQSGGLIDTGAVDFLDGEANTDMLMALHTAGPQTYPAAAACRAMGPQWYLPATQELEFVWLSRFQINLATAGINTTGDQYWSSTQLSSPDEGRAWLWRFQDGWGTNFFKDNPYRVRCFRRD